MSVEKITMNYLKHVGSGFTTILNSTLNLITDAAALGVYVYLASKPENWVIREKDIENHFGMGRDAVRSKLKILKELGLYEKMSIRDAQGKITEWHTNLYRVPKHMVPSQITENQECGENHITENPESGFHHMWQNPPHTKERITTKEKAFKNSLSGDDENLNKDEIKLGCEEFVVSEKTKADLATIPNLTGSILNREYLKFKEYHKRSKMTDQAWDDILRMWMLRAADYIQNNKKIVNN